VPNATLPLPGSLDQTPVQSATPTERAPSQVLLDEILSEANELLAQLQSAPDSTAEQTAHLLTIIEEYEGRFHRFDILAAALHGCGFDQPSDLLKRLQIDIQSARQKYHELEEIEQGEEIKRAQHQQDAIKAYTAALANTCNQIVSE
jgi:hypothetical protein